MAEFEKIRVTYRMQQEQIVRVANRLLPPNMTLSNDVDGFARAPLILGEQHMNVLPSQNHLETWRRVMRNDPEIARVASVARQALSKQDYAKALEHANHLHTYGEVAYKDVLGGHALELSRDIHKVFALDIFDRFARHDSRIHAFGNIALDRAQKFFDRGQTYEEENTYRVFIHIGAYGGILGSEARELLDPYALPSVRAHLE